MSYSNEAKERLLGVPAAVLAAHGAVSAQVARAMAEGARAVRGVVAASVTGVAGPDGGTDAKPVGLTYVAVADADGVDVRRHLWSGDRAANKVSSAAAASSCCSSASRRPRPCASDRPRRDRRRRVSRRRASPAARPATDPAGERIHVVGVAGAGASAAARHAAGRGRVASGCDPGGPSPYTAALDEDGMRWRWGTTRARHGPSRRRTAWR